MYLRALYSLALLFLAVDFKPFYFNGINPFELFAFVGFLGLFNVKFTKQEVFWIVFWLLLPLMILLLFSSELYLKSWAIRRVAKVLGFVCLFKLVNINSFTTYLKYAVLITFVFTITQYILDYDVYYINRSGFTRASSLFGEPKGLALFCVGSLLLLYRYTFYKILLLFQLFMTVSPTGFLALAVAVVFYPHIFNLRLNNYKVYAGIGLIFLSSIIIKGRFLERFDGKNLFKRYVTVNVFGREMLVEQNEQPMIDLIRVRSFGNLWGSGEIVSGLAYYLISSKNDLNEYVRNDRFIAVTPNFALLESIAAYGLLGVFIVLRKRSTFSKLHVFALLSFFVKASYFPSFIVFVENERIGNN